MSDSDRITGPAESAGDDALERAERELKPLLGEPRSGVLASGAGPARRRARLRQAFVSGEFEGDAGVEGPLRERLDAWTVPPASDAFRARVRAEFVDERGVTAPAVRRGAQPASPHARRRTESPTRTTRRPSHVRRSEQRAPFKLLVGSGLLAVAAALLFILLGERGTTNGPSKDSTENVAGASADVVSPNDPSAADVEFTDVDLAAAGSRWTLDREMGDEPMADGWWREVRVDGRGYDSFDALEIALENATVVQVGTAPVRMRRGEQYVLELAEGAEVEFGRDAGPGTDPTRTLYASSGAVRIATGPAFDRTNPLIVQTPHVRTEIVGTILGVDVGPDHSCVCCLEGTVRSVPCPEAGHPWDARSIGAERTLVALAEEDPMELEIVPKHRAPLERLVGYWS